MSKIVCYLYTEYKQKKAREDLFENSKCTAIKKITGILQMVEILKQGKNVQ